MGIISSLLESILILAIVYFIVTYACRILKLLKKILKTLLRIEELLKPVGRATTVEFYTEINGILTKVNNMFPLKVTQNLPLVLKALDAKGNPAQLDASNPPAWNVTDELLATLEIAEDKMSAVLKPVGPLGVVTVTVHGDADLGEGQKDILGTVEIEMIAGDAVSLQVIPGTPVDA